MLDNLTMKLNQNEKCLLKFMADNNCGFSKKSDLMKMVCKLGLKLNFYNTNPINQIIDEMEFETKYKSIIGNKYER